MKIMVLGAIGVLLFVSAGACSGGSSEPDGGDADGQADGLDGGDGPDEGPPACDPACPAGSDCRKLDEFGAPECVTASGALACRDGQDCPQDGDCLDGLCVRHCGCVSDADCSSGGEELVCRNEDLGCGVCLPASAFTCQLSEDCRWIIDASQCCPCPKARNSKAADGDPCLVPVDGLDKAPDECRPDCGQVDHCWPCRAEFDSAGCMRGWCRPGF